ncbi:hypothetical protein PPACK8108_LOCUS7124 [Phakopsora pachyrhizi]|uniref:Uncharacterized protein n=1 Tax=Phakopsora pachyrhizi TaxID=170000 RepID=A0AAV0AU50_PHAPC|nr:hypothetical protein PPACK8108_LOCUS7124 [Phakopsora pachyrhizi]
MSSEDERLYSSEDDNRHPRKFSKTKSTHSICHPSLLAGTSQQPLDVLGDDPFELLIQTLEAQLEIQPGQESFIRNIAQKVERFIEANSVSYIANLDSQSNTSHSVFGANNFVWTKPPKDFIRIMLHQLLISTDVESYAKGTDSESRVIENSLFSLAMVCF